jgi:DNA modification methylase
MKQIKTISIKCETQDKLELAELTELQGGLKERTDVDYDKIKLSIIKYGFSFPLFVWKSGKTNYLLDGHGRFSTLCKMQKDGYIIPPLPVVYVSAKNKTEAKQKLLRLNSQYGKMTKESVLTFAEDIDLNFDEIALPDTVIDFTDATEPQETEGDDEVPEVDEKSEPVSKRGEMYELGKSILMCGDSTNAEDVARLMGGEKADMVFTDPPYGVSYTGGVIHGNKINVNHKREMLQNDDVDIYEKFIPLLNEVIEDGAIYIFYATKNSYELFKPLHDNNIELNAIIAWNKINTGYADMNSHYKNKYEPCIYAKRKGHKLNFVGSTTECTVWDIEKDRDNKLHPTQKPVAVPERAIKNSSKEGDIVLDFFGGSGSTLIACEKNNRKCRIMELDPKYCDVIRRRYTKWAKENGKPITSGCLD